MRLIFVLLLTCMSTFSALAAEQASGFAESADEVRALMNGQVVPNVTVLTAEGDPVSLRALMMQKPSVILFYRGGWCPYCNRQLAGMREVEQKLVQLGYQILAISPETPERLQEQKLSTEMAVTLLSDAKLDAIRHFGIGFYLDADTEQRYEEHLKMKLARDPQTQRVVLPAPAVYLVDKEGMVRFNYVNPNYKVRPSAELIYQAAKLVL